MTVSLLGMELKKAENLLAVLNFAYSIEYYSAVKPLERTDSVRVIRQREENGRILLVASAFQTKAC